MLYSAARFFDGMAWHRGGFETEDGLLTRIYTTLPEGIACRHFERCSIVPAFADAQVYGAGGRLFSAYPDTESLQLLAEHSWAGGAALCQPTVATNSPEVLRACIDALRAYWREGGEGIGGLHIEGPWISPLRKGAHIEAFIHKPTVEEAVDLLSYGAGVIRTITLAPEQCSAEVLRVLMDAGIIVSAGHSNCTIGEAMEAFDGGIRTVTHLYNAMSPLQHRAPGLVGACFLHPAVHASIIPDGHHVAFDAVRIAHANMKGRLFAITDAVTETRIGPYQHQLSAEGYYTSKGTLSGSSLTMLDAFRNLREKSGIGETLALQMCGAIPARVFGWKKQGTLQPGSAAAFLVFDESWNLVERVSEPGSRSPVACGAAHTG